MDAILYSFSIAAFSGKDYRVKIPSGAFAHPGSLVKCDIILKMGFGWLSGHK